MTQGSSSGGSDSGSGIASGGAGATGGAIGAGGSSNTGGMAFSGGTSATGGVFGAGGGLATGGVFGAGGGLATGGVVGAGGSVATGGAPASGGTSSTGGDAAIGGALSTGGTATGGQSSPGGGASGGPPDGGSTAAGGETSGTGGQNQGASDAGGQAGSEASGGGGVVSGGSGNASGGTEPGGAGGAATGGAGGDGDPSGGTGGNQSTGFHPCPESGSCKILPLGDSITFGLGFDGGYRVELFHLALTDNHDITFVGSQPQNGPSQVDGVTFPRKHEGVSGETIEQIANRIPSPGLNEMPHIILLHAGTNDMWAGANGADTRLGALIDELVSEAPDALIVVSNIIPFPGGGASVATYNAAVPGVVAARESSGAHILFVDQFAGFPESELGDGVHPNQAGYARMAAKWYDAIETYLP